MLVVVRPLPMRRALSINSWLILPASSFHSVDIGSNSKGAEFKVTFPRNCVVYAFGISLSCSYTGDARDEDNKEVACDGGCCLKKKTWSIS
ncbi:hypothetical protein Tco_0407239 [Tanacetum coccineum]